MTNLQKKHFYNLYIFILNGISNRCQNNYRIATRLNKYIDLFIQFLVLRSVRYINTHFYKIVYWEFQVYKKD